MDDVKNYIIVGKDSGFTFIEMIVALVLMSILVAIFGMGLVSAVESYEFSRVNVEIAQKGQMAMARIGREIREVTRVIAVNGVSEDPFVIYERVQDVAGQETRIRLGLHFDSAAQRLQLFTNLPQGQTSPPTYSGYTIIDNVENFSLKYFSGTEEWSLSDDARLLATVQIALSLNRYDSPSPQRFISLIHVRNTNSSGGATTDTSTAF